MATLKLDEACIFNVARRIDESAARRQYIEQMCGTDRDALSRICAMLRVHDEDKSFLEPPAASFEETIDSADGERVGTEIGPYKLMERIGEGGMGLVFVAEQQRPVRRKVAVKVIKPGMDTREVIARFEAERQALALMDHPNIARVLDAGTTPAGRPFFVMELVRGVPITEFCDSNRLTLRERLELFVHVCNAVQHAHQKGIIHRDLKASNILITLHDATPVVKVIDFGVVKAIGQQLTEKTIYTRFSEMIGTPMYMSPEQAEMSGLDIDTRSDIYSLGVLLYELLTGTTPFDTERMRTVAFDEMRRIIREEEPPRPSKRISTLATLECDGLTPLLPGTSAPKRPDDVKRQSGSAANESGNKSAHSKDLKTIAAERRIEPRKLSQLFLGELDWIVMKAVEKDRNQRYETASAFAADVMRYLHDERVLACPPTVGYRLRKFARRNRGPVLAGTLVLLALLGGIIGTTWQMLVATGARSTAVNESKQKEAALATAQASERDAKDKLFMALLNEAQARRFSRKMGQRLDSLAALAKAASIRPDERLRDEAIAAIALPDVRLVPVACSAPTGTTALAFDGQYRLCARADTQGIISIRNVADDREIQHIASGSILTDCLYFSTDDRFLLGLGEGKTLGVWGVADGQRVIRSEFRGCWAHAFSPDGRRLAVGQPNRVSCFDLATGQELIHWSVPAEPHSLAFHRDSRQLAVGLFRSNSVTVYDATNGAVVTELPVGSIDDQVIAWHPNGELIAVTGSDPHIEIWNVAAKRKLATLEGHVQHVPTLTFHPNGNLLASHSWDGVLRLWDVATGRSLLQLPLAVNWNPHFSGDGRWLGAARHGEQTELLELTPSREYRTLVASEGIGRGAYNPADISPDGRLLTVGKVEGMAPGARLWDLQNGRELGALPVGTNFVFFDGTADPALSPQGSVNAEKNQGPRAPDSEPWSLLTCGSDGLRRWPVTSDGERLRLGPPQQLSTLHRAWFARSPDGRTLGAVTEEGGSNKILDLETGTVLQDVGIHPGGEVRALSADGRWAASSGWRSDRVRLWNVGTGEMVHDWLVGYHTFVYFTPDSRALIISRGDEFSFWDIESFEPTLRLPRDVAQYPGHVAFSPDGKLMAVEMTPAVIHLKDAASGRTVAKLEDPHGDRASWQGFTPDGTQLVVVASYASAIHVWDFRAIRARLKEMNLDWDWPTFPERSAITPGAGLAPLTIEVVDRPTLDRANQSGRRGDWQTAADQFRQLLESGPVDQITESNHAMVYEYAPVLVKLGQIDDYHTVCSLALERFAGTSNPVIAERTAKMCLLAPPTKENLQLADTLAARSVELGQNHQYLTYFEFARALAYYRAGRWHESLNSSIESQQHNQIKADYVSYLVAATHLLQAMIHHQRNEPEEAQGSFKLAEEIFDGKLPQPDSDDLGVSWFDWLMCDLLRSEAKALIHPDAARR